MMLSEPLCNDRNACANSLLLLFRLSNWGLSQLLRDLCHHIVMRVELHLQQRSYDSDSL